MEARGHINKMEVSSAASGSLALDKAAWSRLPEVKKLSRRVQQVMEQIRALKEEKEFLLFQLFQSMPPETQQQIRDLAQSPGGTPRTPPTTTTIAAAS